MTLSGYILSVIVLEAYLASILFEKYSLFQLGYIFVFSDLVLTWGPWLISLYQLISELYPNPVSSVSLLKSLISFILSILGLVLCSGLFTEPLILFKFYFSKMNFDRIFLLYNVITKHTFWGSLLMLDFIIWWNTVHI